MKLDTIAGIPVNSKMLKNYFQTLISLFFKILPLWENGEGSLETYMRSLQMEMLGCESLINAIHQDSMFLSLLSILQALIDAPGTEIKTVKREVFRAISICNKLQKKYNDTEVDAE